MSYSCLPTCPNNSVQLTLSVCYKRYYWIDIDAAAQAGLSTLFDCFENSARWGRTWLDDSSSLFIACSYRPYQKTIVAILSMKLQVTLNQCRLGKHIVGYVIFLQNLNASSSQLKTQLCWLVWICSGRYHYGHNSI